MDMVKMAILPKEIYRVNAITIKLPMTFFTTLEPMIQTFIWTHKRARIARAILRNRNQAGDFGQYSKAMVIKTVWAILRNRNQAGDFGQYSKAMVIKTVWSWYQNRHTAPWTRIHNLEINPDTYGQLIFNKGGENVKVQVKDGLFSKWCWENGTAAWISMKPSHHAEK